MRASGPRTGGCTVCTYLFADEQVHILSSGMHEPPSASWAYRVLRTTKPLRLSTVALVQPLTAYRRSLEACTRERVPARRGIRACKMQRNPLPDGAQVCRMRLGLASTASGQSGKATYHEVPTRNINSHINFLGLDSRALRSSLPL
jgi:hypothetical protein